MDKLNWVKRACAFFALCAATAIGLPAQTTFTTLHSFDDSDGENPYAALVQATDGRLYGMTVRGGVNDNGTVFKIASDGTLTTLHRFDGTDGSEPLGALVQATNGNFYGTTIYGGASGSGTVFEITPGGTLTTLYSFGSQSGDGFEPRAGLVQGTGGDLYGTTYFGGVTGGGTVFKITTGGTLTTLYSFCSQSSCADGSGPEAALIQAADGNFYGTTFNGGKHGRGTVFGFTPSGVLTTLYSFCSQNGCADGAEPFSSALAQGSDRNLYGTTLYGGSLGAGTVFKITLSGTLTTLYSFCQNGCRGGDIPEGGLIQATDGNLYGTTQQGGANGVGTIFKITPTGTLTTLYSFCSQSGCPDGEAPGAAVVQDTNGSFYGTTLDGGVGACFNGCGAAFSLSVGLGPFVDPQTTTGKVGEAVKILGTNLTGATRVSFNGTAATFKVVSGSLITATIPVGATSGKVRVVTPSGTLSSNVRFRVLP